MNKIEHYLKEKPELSHTVVGYIHKGDEVLLGVRKKVSFGLGEQLIAGIGGKVELNETTDEALVREFMEEIKVNVIEYRNLGQVIYLFPHKPKWNQQVSIYLISKSEGEAEETDEIKPLWFRESELPKDRMWPDNLYTIPLVLEGKRITGTFLYNEDGEIDEHKLEELNNF